MFFTIINFLIGLATAVIGLLMIVVALFSGPSQLQQGRAEYVAKHKRSFGLLERLFYLPALGRILCFGFGIFAEWGAWAAMLHPSHL